MPEPALLHQKSPREYMDIWIISQKAPLVNYFVNRINNFFSEYGWHVSKNDEALAKISPKSVTVVSFCVLEMLVRVCYNTIGY